MKRRGTRIVTGYVISLSGKKGGDLLQRRREGLGIFRTEHLKHAELVCTDVKKCHPDAKVLPVVRYELDREEERLRDAVVPWRAFVGLRRCVLRPPRAPGEKGILIFDQQSVLVPLVPHIGSFQEWLYPGIQSWETLFRKPRYLRASLSTRRRILEYAWGAHYGD